MRIPVVLAEGATLPQYQTPGSAGMDLRCTTAFELKPGERKAVPTGVKVAIPNGFEGQVRPRSGLAMRHGVGMVNAPGTIDPDFRGEIQVLLINFGEDTVKFASGDRIAQLVICPVIRAEWEPVETLDETLRGEGGFGSTGKQ